MAESKCIFVSQLGNDDVLIGRGTGPNTNEGNVRFRDLVSKRKAVYLSISPRDHKNKNRIAREIVDTVRSRGGRFLKRVVAAPGSDDGNSFVLENEEIVMEKAKQALRKNRTARLKQAAGGANADADLQAEKTATAVKSSSANLDGQSDEPNIDDQLFSMGGGSPLPPVTSSADATWQTKETTPEVKNVTASANIDDQFHLMEKVSHLPQVVSNADPAWQAKKTTTAVKNSNTSAEVDGQNHSMGRRSPLSKSAPSADPNVEASWQMKKRKTAVKVSTTSGGNNGHSCVGETLSPLPLPTHPQDPYQAFVAHIQRSNNCGTSSAEAVYRNLQMQNHTPRQHHHPHGLVQQQHPCMNPQQSQNHTAREQQQLHAPLQEQQPNHTSQQHPSRGPLQQQLPQINPLQVQNHAAREQQAPRVLLQEQHPHNDPLQSRVMQGQNPHFATVRGGIDTSQYSDEVFMQQYKALNQHTMPASAISGQPIFSTGTSTGGTDSEYIRFHLAHQINQQARCPSGAVGNDASFLQGRAASENPSTRIGATAGHSISDFEMKQLENIFAGTSRGMRYVPNDSTADCGPSAHKKSKNNEASREAYMNALEEMSFLSLSIGELSEMSSLGAPRLRRWKRSIGGTMIETPQKESSSNHYANDAVNYPLKQQSSMSRGRGQYDNSGASFDVQMGQTLSDSQMKSLEKIFVGASRNKPDSQIELLEKIFVGTSRKKPNFRHSSKPQPHVNPSFKQRRMNESSESLIGSFGCVEDMSLPSMSIDEMSELSLREASLYSGLGSKAGRRP